MKDWCGSGNVDTAVVSACWNENMGKQQGVAPPIASKVVQALARPKHHDTRQLLPTTSPASHYVLLRQSSIVFKSHRESADMCPIRGSLYGYGTMCSEFRG